MTFTETTNPAAHKAGASSDPGGTEVTMVMPDPKAAGITMAKLAARNQDATSRARNSVIVSAMAAGDTYESAVAAFGKMDPTNVPTKAQAEAALGRPVSASSVNSAKPASLTTASRTAPAAVMAAQTLDSACADINASGPTRFAHACDLRTLDYSYYGDWYIGNKGTVSGYVHDWWYVMSEISSWNSYYSGNSWVSWSPSGPRPYSACGTSTVSATDPKTGISISESNNECPDHLDPVWYYSALGFGSAWYGYRSDTMGAESVGVVHNPPGKSAAYVVHLYMTWS